MEEEFRVSKKLLRTLTADTRTKILKALEDRPMTASELSRKLNRHVTTITEHLERLRDSELVQRVERPGRKWIYYRLTDTGRRILHPRSYRWVIVFSFTFLCFVAGIYVVALRSYPGSLLYPVKRSIENFQVATVSDPISKAEIYLQYAGKRLEEAKIAADSNDTQTLKKSLIEYEEEMKRTNSEIERAKLMNKSLTSILEKVKESTAKYKAVLEYISIKIPAMKKDIQPIVNKTTKTYTAATEELKSILERK